MSYIKGNVDNIQFDAENHRYMYHGRELLGVTGTISQMLGKVFPDGGTGRPAGLEVRTIHGTDVHRAVELYYNEGGEKPRGDALFCVNTIDAFCRDRGFNPLDVRCEVMVSDFRGTASKVDVVVYTGGGDSGVYLFDIKTTARFDREYCTLQLSTYRALWHLSHGTDVLGLYVISTEDRRLYGIVPCDFSKVQYIVEENKRKSGYDVDK